MEGSCQYYFSLLSLVWLMWLIYVFIKYLRQIECFSFLFEQAVIQIAMIWFIGILFCCDHEGQCVYCHAPRHQSAASEGCGFHNFRHIHYVDYQPYPWHPYPLSNPTTEPVLKFKKNAPAWFAIVPLGHTHYILWLTDPDGMIQAHRKTRQP